MKINNFVLNQLCEVFDVVYRGVAEEWGRDEGCAEGCGE